MATVSANGAELYYEESGEGTPIVFLHGVMMGGRFFVEQEDLPEGYRSIALDFRGHGRSEKTETGHTVPTYAADLESFLAELGLDDVVLVGWSMGSLVGWEYIEQFGTDRLAGYVVVDQQPVDLEQEDFDYGVFDFDELVDLMELAQTDPHALADLFVDQMIHGEGDADVERLIFDEISRVPPAIKSAILFDQSVRDYRDTLNDVDVPTLVCTGTDDTLVDPAGVEYVANNTPNAEIERFEASSHCPFLEEPERFNEKLIEFVDRVF